MTGIYIITNELNDHCYVGQTSRTFEKRFDEHKNALKKNQHLCSNGKPDYLQNAWNKYGEDNFTFDILEVVEDIDLLDERERYWIAYYNSFKNGYNQTEGGGGCIGYKFTKEQSENLSKILKGKNKGKKLSDEHKQKISEGYNNLPEEKKEEIKKKQSEKIKGIPKSEEHKRRISEALKGKSKPEEHKIRMSKLHKGKKISDEQKIKISEALSGEKNPNYKPRTPEMIEDVKNGMRHKDFLDKYQNVSSIIYYSIKNEFKN